MGPNGGLTRGEVRKVLKKLRQLGVKPPRIGRCVVVRPRDDGASSVFTNYNPHAAVELCRHPRNRYIPNDTGYQIVTYRREHGLFGARGRRKRRRKLTAAQLRDKLACKVFGGKACR